MPTGAITGYVDVAQLVLYVFWIFFAGLIFYLRREDKREGYPLEPDPTDRSSRITVLGFPRPPGPKVFSLPHGGTYEAPARPDRRTVHAEPAAPWPGAPLQPVGDPMKAGVGPGSYAERTDEPELTLHGEPRMVPLRVAPTYGLAPRDTDPRGMEVVGADGRVGGVVRELWVDRSEPQVRFYELEVAGPEPRRVLLPVGFARVDARRGQVRVQSLMGDQLRDVPGIASSDRVTQREEDRIVAWYGGGTLYAEPSRTESLL